MKELTVTSVLLHNMKNVVMFLLFSYSQKASLSELKVQIDEERDQRREEREKAAADLKAAVQKAHAEAQDELKRLSDASSRREREQLEVINKLQVSLIIVIFFFVGVVCLRKFCEVSLKNPSNPQVDWSGCLYPYF